MPTKYKAVPEELQKIDYGTAKSHYANVRFKQGLPKIAGGDIKKGTQAYNEIVLLQKTLKEKDFVLLLAELADRSPEHWQMMTKYYEKRGWDYKIAGQVLADAKAFYGESNKGPLDSISNLAIAGGGGGPIQEAPKPLPPPLVTAPKVNKGYPAGFLNLLPNIDPFSQDYFRGPLPPMGSKELTFKGFQAQKSKHIQESEELEKKDKEDRQAKKKLGQELVEDYDKRHEVEQALDDFYLPEDKKAEEESLRTPLSFPKTQIARTPAQKAEEEAWYKDFQKIKARVAQRLYWSCFYIETTPQRQKIMSTTQIILDAYYGPMKQLYPVVDKKVVGIKVYTKVPVEFQNIFMTSELEALETYSYTR